MSVLFPRVQSLRPVQKTEEAGASVDRIFAAGLPLFSAVKLPKKSSTHFVIQFQFHILNFLFSVFPEPQRARASCLGRNRVGVSNRAEPAENRRAQRRHRLGRHTRNPASTSHGRLRSGVDLFGRASRGTLKPITTNMGFFTTSR